MLKRHKSQTTDDWIKEIECDLKARRDCGLTSQFILSRNAFRIKHGKDVIAYWDRTGILILQDGSRLKAPTFDSALKLLSLSC